VEILSLKSHIERKIGFRIDSISGCRRLEALMKSNGIYVSYTTLSRILGLAKISANPRIGTLNELSLFIGFEDYYSFCNFYKENEDFNRIKLISGLELDVLLKNNEEKKAIDSWIKMKDEYPSVFAYNSQFICRHLFGRPERIDENIDYLLSHDEIALEILQLFVYEDDPYGHYDITLKRLVQSNKSLDELEVFYNLFHARKTILKGNKSKINLHINDNLHFHLISRFYEIELLLKKLSDKEIIERTNRIISLVQIENDSDKSFAYIGRWCRGLIMTDKNNLLENNSAWKQKCLLLVEKKDGNMEFQVIIYCFLILTYKVSSSLDFMQRGQWGNAKIESNLMFSKAFGKTEAHQFFKEVLGYK